MKRFFLILLALSLVSTAWGAGQKDGESGEELSRNEVIIVAGPNTPESLDQGYPPTPAGHDARRNIYERLLEYEKVENEDGILVENFDKLAPGLAKEWKVSDDFRSITLTLRQDAYSWYGNQMTADDVMWSFERGWAIKANFYWYMTQVLKIEDFDYSFKKLDKWTVKITLPNPSPFLAEIWVNNDLGIIDATEAKKHITADDPWIRDWMGTHSASFAPYHVTKFTPGQEVIYEANPNYYRGEARTKKIIFKEIPESSNRVASLQAGSVDVVQWLEPRELNMLMDDPNIKIWNVKGNYIHRVELCNEIPPFDNVKVRQALNYLVPREEILKNVYYGWARATKSPCPEIYPAYTDEYWKYPMKPDVAKAKRLLAEAGYADGFKVPIGYRTGRQIEEEIAVILRDTFKQANIDLVLEKQPSSTLVEKYTNAKIASYFFLDMPIVPDAAYSHNLWLNSKSLINYPRYHNEEVDELIDWALSSTDQPKRYEAMERVQELVVEEAPWIFLFNPGFQLSTRTNVKGVSWYTPNPCNWYDFYKE